MNLIDLWDIITRRVVLFAVVFGSTFVAFWFGTKPAPARDHLATTSVLIGPDPKVLPRQDPLVPAPSYWSFKNKMRSLRERPVLRCAVELMRGDRSFISPVFAEGDVPGRIDSFRAHFAELDGDRDTARWIHELENAVRVHHRDRAQLVSISVLHSHASIATLASWAIAEAAGQVHAERVMAPVVEYSEALVGTLSELRSELKSARERLAEEERKHRPSFRQRIISIRKAQEDLTREWGTLVADFDSTKYAAKRAKAVLSLRPPEPVTREIRWLRDEWVEAERNLATVRLEYRDEHPKVVKALHRWEHLRSRLADHPEAGPEYALKLSQAQRDIREHEAIAMRRDVLESRRAELLEEAAVLGAAVAATQPYEHEVLRLEIALRRYERLATRLESARLWKAGPVAPYQLAKVASPVAPPPIPSRTMWGLVISALVAAAGVSLREVLDTRIRSTQEICARTGEPPIAVLPHVSGHDSESRQAALAPLLYPVEAFLERRPELRTIAITSPTRGDGKSTVARGLAEGLARRGRRVVLVDADLRSAHGRDGQGLVALIAAVDQTLRPEFGRNIGERLSAGRIGVLELPRTVADVVVPTEVPRLDVIPTGRIDLVEEPGEVFAHRLSRGNVERVVGALAGEYDHVIIDLPPLSLFADAIPFAQAVDGSLLVFGSNVSESVAVDETLQQLRGVGAPVIGSILNGAD